MKARLAHLWGWSGNPEPFLIEAWSNLYISRRSGAENEERDIHEEGRQILESGTPNRSPHDRTNPLRSLSSINGLDG